VYVTLIFFVNTSKKQKVVGEFAVADQIIEKLNDVTAVSGMNLRVYYMISSLLYSISLQTTSQL
jgi:hypothetical protein